ncbi:hypothetical protein YC2023_086112 [Brassica napus]
MEMDTDEALHHLCHRFSGAYEKRDSEKNRKRTRQGFTSLTPQQRMCGCGRKLYGCGHCGHETWNQVRSGQIRGDRGCVDVIGVDGSCMDVVIVDMRLGIKCEVAR